MNELIKRATFNRQTGVLQSFDAEWKRYFILIECLILFFITPVILYWFRHLLAFRLLPVLLFLALGCIIYMSATKAFDFSIFWNTRNFLSHTKSILVTFTCISILIGLLTYLVYEDRFFVFPIDRPNAALIFILMYPLLSAVPQEIIFKCFFFHRYGALFPGPLSLIFFNGLSFGLFHLWYGNAVAPVLSLFAGMLMAYRYLKTNSLLLVSIEHSLMGILIYIVGLGWFFYSGSIQ